MRTGRWPQHIHAGALRQRRLWLVLSVWTLIMGGVLATYSYITPLLTERAGLPEGAVPLVLIVFGVGALGGVTIGGRLGDRHPMDTTITASAATALVLLLLIPLSSRSMATVLLVFLMGLTGFAVNPVVSALAMRLTGSAPTLAAACAARGPVAITCPPGPDRRRGTSPVVGRATERPGVPAAMT